MQVVDANGNMYGDDNLEINDVNGKPKTTGGGGGGGVTSVGTTGLISGGPITTTGTISTSMNTNKLVGRSTAGPGIMEEITVGSGLTLSSGTLNNTATPTPLGYYGAWQDDITQTAAASNTGYAMIYRITDITPNGISIVSNGTNPTRITFANTGIYNIQFSSQFQNLANSPQDVTIWLRKNGTDVTGSAGVIGMEARKNPGDPYHTIAGWNYVLSVVAGEYYELVWSTTDHTNVQMHFYAAGSPPPSAASVILTVTQQSGIMAGTGITALNSLTGAAQTFGNDTNVTMVSSGTNHAITWAGTLADSRIASASTWNAKQDALVSGTNIKTINSTSLLGSGDIAISSSPYTTVGNSAGVLVNGTTSNTISASILIPANTLVATQVLQLRAQVRKISGTGTSNIRFYFNTTNSLVGATQIGQAQNMTGSGQMQRVARDFYIDTTFLLCYLPTNPIATDLSSGSVSTILYTLANPYYLIAAVQNSTLTELAIVTRLNLMTY
jgi:hypothetical protein